jgi:16S rRNA processing protein RimM
VAEFAAIGKVINTHGVKGGLKVQPLSDFPERVKMLERVFVEKDGSAAPHEISEAFIHGRFWVVFLQGTDTCEKAQAMVGSMLSIPLEERLPLPDGAYYLDQIIGLQVYTVGDRYLGKVQDVLQTGSNDVYVVKDGEQREMLIPALKAVVRDIDLTQCRMVVDPPEGLL